MNDRYDVGTLDSVEKTPQGGLRVAAHLTRTGVFHYDDGKGGMIAEYRPPDEVAHADSLATLLDAPLTVGHSGLVTPDNHAANANGHVRDPRMDGERVAAMVVVQGRKAIRAIEKGTRQVSCGYTCKLDEISGVTPGGERYDRVQRGIRYNHVALVDRGRAGDDVRLRLDAAGNQSLEEYRMDAKDTKVVERIDGVDYDMGTDAHRAAVTRRDEAEKVRKGALDALQAKYDAAAAKVPTLEQEIVTLKDPARLDAAATARASLLELARKVCGAETKFDGKADAVIRREVAAKANPALRLDGKSDEYVQALFDTAAADIAKAAARADAERAGNASLRVLVDAPVIKQDGATETRLDADAEWEKMRERNCNAWKQPAAAAAKGA